MAGPYTPGNIELVKRNFNEMVHNIVAAKQIMKQLVLVQRSTAGIERFYRESITELVDNTQIPRDAEFYSDQVILDDLDVRPRKFGLESRVAWEDTIVTGPNIPQRTTIRIGNRVARGVDTRIWNILTDNQSAVDINTLAVSATWDNATRANRIPHEDIAEAVSVVMRPVLQAYTPDTLFLNAKEYAFVRTNDYVMSSFDSSGPALMERGIMGMLLGLTVVVNPVVTADYAAVADAKKSLTWAEVAPLTTNVEDHPGKYVGFSAFEYGNAALTDPKAVCLITDTEA